MTGNRSYICTYIFTLYITHVYLSSSETVYSIWNLSPLAFGTNTHTSYSIPEVCGSLARSLWSGKMRYLTGWLMKRLWISLLCSHKDFRKVLLTSCSQVHKTTVTNTGRIPPVFRVLQISWRKETYGETQDLGTQDLRDTWEQEVRKGMLLGRSWGFPFAFDVFWCWREVYFCTFVVLFFLSLYFPSFIREGNNYRSQATVIQLSKVYLSIIAVKKGSKHKWWALWHSLQKKYTISLPSNIKSPPTLCPRIFFFSWFLIENRFFSYNTSLYLPSLHSSTPQLLSP